MDNQNYEQEIDLKDLVFTVFHKWRGIILTAVIFGILLGGYKLGAGLTSKMDAEAVQKIQEEYNDSLEVYERATRLYEIDLETISTQIESQEEYLANSVLMNLNPYHKNVALVDIFVTANPQNTLGESQILTYDPADSILRAYESLIKSEALKNVPGIDIDSIYLKELVNTHIDYEGNVLSVSTTYKDEQGAKAILDVLLEGVHNKESELESEFGEYKVLFMNETTSVVTDIGLYDSRQKAFNMLTALKKSLTDKEAELNSIKEPTALSSISTTASLNRGIKYGILGGVLGAFLSIFCICIIFLMSDKLNSEKELKNRFGLKILGVFDQVPRKGVFSCVDRWLDRLEGKVSKKPAEVYEIVAANIKNYMAEGKSIMILGSASVEKTVEITEELKQRAPGVEFHIGQSMGISAETLRCLPQAGQIILVEERGSTKCGEIQNRVEIIRSLDKSIVGCIVL